MKNSLVSVIRYMHHWIQTDFANSALQEFIHEKYFSKPTTFHSICLWDHPHFPKKAARLESYPLGWLLFHPGNSAAHIWMACMEWSFWRSLLCSLPCLWHLHDTVRAALWLVHAGGCSNLLQVQGACGFRIRAHRRANLHTEGFFTIMVRKVKGS